MITKLTEQSAAEIKMRILAREISVEDIVKAVLSRINSVDDGIHAFLNIDSADALKRAKALDAKLASGKEPGALFGIPVAVKDNICVAGGTATCGSKSLENYRPPYSATVAQKLLDADAVIIGKTNMDEFAMGSSGENSAFGPARNPWNIDCAPGGSSSGSAAAVAACEAYLALGSDTGGSIRQPASFCGIVGLKPTYGLVSRYGLVAFASSLDQIGPMARTVEDAALLLGVIAGHDPADSTSSKCEIPDYLANLNSGVKGKRIGLPREFLQGMDASVENAFKEAVDVFKKLGAEIKEVSLTNLEYALPVYYIEATAEASSNLARYDGVHYGRRTDNASDLVSLYSRTREEFLGAEVKRRIMLGTYVLSAGYYDAYYKKALQVRRLIKEDFDRVFADVDLILCPTSPTPAFRLGEKVADPLTMYLSDIYTIPVNLAGIPAVSVNCGFSDDGLPIGLQVIGRPFGESEILSAAYAYEQAVPQLFEGRRVPVLS